MDEMENLILPENQQFARELANNLETVVYFPGYRTSRVLVVYSHKAWEICRGLYVERLGTALESDFERNYQLTLHSKRLNAISQAKQIRSTSWTTVMLSKCPFQQALLSQNVSTLRQDS